MVRCLAGICMHKINKIDINSTNMSREKGLPILIYTKRYSIQGLPKNNVQRIKRKKHIIVRNLT